MRQFIFKSLTLVLFICIPLTGSATPPILHPKMKILIVGNGGREHALAWKAAQSKWVQTVYVAPGNAGTALEKNVQNINIPADDIAALLAFAQSNKVDLTIVGPELPLAQGIVDKFNSVGQHCFGPTSAAARLESSKVFSKEFMHRNNIPTAAYANFSDFASAKNYILTHKVPIVIKADGLASGKGVLVAHTKDEAINFLNELLINGAMNNAGKSVVIEEFLQGEEISYIVVSDGKNVIPLATSQDHKQLHDQDQGPNTGGMGAYSPVNILSPATDILIQKQIVAATINAMAAEHVPYSGFLYVGLMMTKDGPKVLEYNCRLGDPEAQALLVRLKSDIVEICAASLEQRLDKVVLNWDPRSAIAVVIASANYPLANTETKFSLSNAYTNDLKIFHGNTKQDGNIFTSNSGRVFSVVVLGNTLTDAHAKAYNFIDQNKWDKVQYRKDIGYRELSRETLAQNSVP
jgi:phosphoribosylamine--glycine ligase